MESRRSTRAKGKATANANTSADLPGVQDDSYVEPAESDELPPPKKRRKPSTKTPKSKLKSETVNSSRSRKGKLRHLPEMPLDILFEVFGHLRPIDLLNLSRTTKALRNILMRRSAITLWKSSLRSVESLPECPPDLTEPQYAHLAFDPHCHFCYALCSQNIYWACRLRVCKACISEHFIESREVEALFPNVADKYNWATTLLPSIRIPSRRSWERRLSPRKQADSVAQTLKELINDSERLNAFVIERANFVVSLNNHAGECERWYAEVGDLRSQELADIRRRRKEAILKRLEGLGWGDDISKMNKQDHETFSRQHSVKQTRDLTDRIWLNIKDGIIEFMQDLKEKRLNRERRERIHLRQKVVKTLLDQYSRTRPYEEIHPGLADVCLMEDFKKVIDLPEDAEVTEASFGECHVLFIFDHLTCRTFVSILTSSIKISV
ncbi:hypothetical protein JAAARDRAFT_77035 [Jaapia argillacea MUCL 33604]|uniref:F-box domain-containing protein n=1 Tax=Jaapia argillacea MUCL 33604 TaxID=933084 RepID=A0A067Q423_9AGAM|nr:hypothetical protein JAAARDRAFT_77035 [Jaapia argillacea MUCL 33604]